MGDSSISGRLSDPPPGMCTAVPQMPIMATPRTVPTLLTLPLELRQHILILAVRLKADILLDELPFEDIFSDYTTQK